MTSLSKSGWRSGVIALTALATLSSAGLAFAEPRAPTANSTGTPTVTNATETGWLVPWPTTDDSASDPGALNQAGDADAGPRNPEAETLDEALQAYRSARSARLAWRNAEKLLTVAEQREANAIASANTLTTVAENKKAIADIAAARVESIARQAYINGTTPEIDALLIEDPDESRDALTGIDRVAGFLSFQIGESKTAATDAVEAAAKASNAVMEAQTIRGEVERLRTLIDEQKEIERQSRATFKDFMEDQGTQIEIGPDGCPKENVDTTLRGGALEIGAAKLCRKSVREAATPQAALAIKYAFSKLGAPYACEGVGRMGEFRFDCSSLTSRAYAETVGIPFAANAPWAHSTRDMMPWGGVSLDPHYVEVKPGQVRPGDLLLYRSCTSEPCNFQHVTMALADGFMLHTNSCGDVAHITKAPGYGPGSSFVVARRVVFLPGEEALVEKMKKAPWLPPKKTLNFDDSIIFRTPQAPPPSPSVNDTPVPSSINPQPIPEEETE